MMPIRLGRDAGDVMSVEEAIEMLCLWAPYAPLKLPTMRSCAYESGFLAPRLIVQNRRKMLLAELKIRTDMRARLAHRELERLKEMPRVAKQIARTQPEWESYVTTVRQNLEWLDAA